jgi:DNA-binding transcriptional ArsR family regulator
VSKHLSILKQAHLVESRKNGRWVYYARPQGWIPASVRDALEWVDTSLARDPQVRKDAKQIKRIAKIPVEELCRLVDEG